MAYTVEVLGSMLAINPQSWDALIGDMPLLSHAFLSAFESSGSVGKGTGWQPCPMVVYENGELVAAMPLYFKSHSYGEYVFDWAWADAYLRNGLKYYPKLLSAIPFTPITSERLLVKATSNAAELKKALLTGLAKLMQKHQLSSIHINFPDDACAATLKQAGWLQRQGVQFRWENHHFADFDAFLSTLSHDKRKKIRQERNKIKAAGVTCQRIKGADITPEHWQFFYQCYENTYREHQSTPYLTPVFFKQIGQAMPDNVLLIVASINDKPIAAALNIYHQAALYGRYWGSLQYVPNLHFELCYYQAQEFCIAENIRFFEGGAQGEHKLARGFKPRPTCSFHQIAHPDFKLAIADFVQKESQSVAVYTSELEERAPFKAAFK